MITPMAPPKRPPKNTRPEPEKMFPRMSSDTLSQFWMR